MKFKQAVAEFVPQIETEIQRYLTPATETIDPFWGMMLYHLGWRDDRLQPVQARGGKRLRPVFTILACQAENGDPAVALPAAAAVELVHNFTLIHDDIQDNSDTRSGRPTVWKIWGVPQAINAGDAMFTLARNALLKLREKGISAETVLDATACLDRTLMKLCRGQYLDMAFEETMSVQQETYLEMIAGKTAALLACSGYLGALVATETPATAERYWQFGHALGMAFQMQDDILGIWGDPAVVGKPIGDDLRRHKKTMPVIFTLSQPETTDIRRFRELYRQSELTDKMVAEAVSLLEKIGAKTYTEAQTERYTRRAQQILDSIGENGDAKETLQDMLTFLLARTY